jgi:hypothetical protein
MPILVFGFIFYFLPELVAPIPAAMFGPLLLRIAMSTFIAPCVLVLILYKFGVVSTSNIEHRKDRFIPQIFATVLYAATTWVFYYSLSIVPAMFLLMASMTACMLCVTVINFFWKISAHSTAMGGLCGLAFFISCQTPSPIFNLAGFACLFLAGLVMSARLYLQVHTLPQVCSGFVLGLVIATWGVSNIY